MAMEKKTKTTPKIFNFNPNRKNIYKGKFVVLEGLDSSGQLTRRNY